MGMAMVEILGAQKDPPTLVQAILPNEGAFEYHFVDFPVISAFRVAWAQPPPSDAEYKRALDYLAAIRDHCRAVFDREDPEGAGDYLAGEILALMDESPDPGPDEPPAIDWPDEQP